MDITVAIVTMIPVILAVALIINVVRKNITREPGEPLHIVEAVPAVIVLLVAVMIIGSMASSIDNEFELYDCEPLSSFGSGATIEGDCAEVVTIDGIQYVRMTDLGTFTATSGGNSTEYNVTKAKMDLIVWSGQSNSMAYNNPSFYDGPATIAPGKGFYFGDTDDSAYMYAGIIRSESDVETATFCDIVADDGSMRVASMYPAFYGDYYQETGHRIMTVSTGIAGIGIASWDDGGDSDRLMEAALEAVKERSVGKIELTPVAVLWVQGEADALRTEAYYLEHFEPLLEKLETGYYAGMRFPIITASLPRTNMAPIDSMIPPALAQIEAASSDPRFTIATELAYRATADQYRDSVHFEQEYYGWVGEAFARQLAILKNLKPVKETIVLVGDVSTVAGLPSTVEAYGTSGKAYQLNVAWTETETPDTYSGALSGYPSTTRLLDGLTAVAVIDPEDYDDSTKTLTIKANVATAESYPWDSYASNVESLVIQDGVQSVGAGVFSDLTGIEFLYIPESLTSIGTSAFGVSFENYMGQSLNAEAGRYAGSGGTLYRCDPSIFTYSSSGSTVTGLKSSAASSLYLVMPVENNGTTITKIEGGAFRDNTVVSKALITPDSHVTEVGASCFQGCTSLAEVTLPGTLTTLGGSSFRGTAITSIEIPAGVTEIANYTFAYVTTLVSATIPSTVTSIGSYAFAGCSALSSADIPSSVTAIGERALLGAPLTSVALPGGLASIGSQAFNACNAVTSVTFGAGFAATLGTSCFNSWTFYDTDGTTELDKMVTSNLAGFTFTGTASALVKQA